MEQDAQRARAERALGYDEFTRLERQCLRAHHAAIDGNRRDHNDKDDRPEARTQHDDHGEREHYGWERTHGVEEQHQAVVEPARAIACEHAQPYSDGERRRYGEERYPERDSTTVEYPCKEIATKMVGTQHMAEARARHTLSDVQLRRTIGRKRVGTDRTCRDQADEE